MFCLFVIVCLLSLNNIFFTKHNNMAISGELVCTWIVLTKIQKEVVNFEHKLKLFSLFWKPTVVRICYPDEIKLSKHYQTAKNVNTTWSIKISFNKKMLPFGQNGRNKFSNSFDLTIIYQSSIYRSEKQPHTKNYQLRSSFPK